MANLSDDGFYATLDSYSGTRPFRAWVQTVLPEVYNDSLSYQELVYKMLYYLRVMIDDIDIAEGNIDTLNEAYTNFANYMMHVVEDYTAEYEVFKQSIDNQIATLKTGIDTFEEGITTRIDDLEGTYDDFKESVATDISTYTASLNSRITAFEDSVNNYFDNLDITSAIHLRLDELAADGTLSEMVRDLVTDEGIQKAVEEWLEENTDADTGYVVDKSLTVSGAAADAEAVGEELAARYTVIDAKWIPWVRGRGCSKSIQPENGPFITENNTSYCTIPFRVCGTHITINNNTAFNVGYEAMFFNYDGVALSAYSNTTVEGKSSAVIELPSVEIDIDNITDMSAFDEFPVWCVLSLNIGAVWNDARWSGISVGNFEIELAVESFNNLAIGDGGFSNTAIKKTTWGGVFQDASLSDGSAAIDYSVASGAYMGCPHIYHFSGYYQIQLPDDTYRILWTKYIGNGRWEQSTSQPSGYYNLPDGWYYLSFAVVVTDDDGNESQSTDLDEYNLDDLYSTSITSLTYSDYYAKIAEQG